MNKLWLKRAYRKVLKTGFTLRSSQEEPKSLGDCVEQHFLLKPDWSASEDRQHCATAWDGTQVCLSKWRACPYWGDTGNPGGTGALRQRWLRKSKVAAMVWMIPRIGRRVNHSPGHLSPNEGTDNLWSTGTRLHMLPWNPWLCKAKRVLSSEAAVQKLLFGSLILE